MHIGVSPYSAGKGGGISFTRTLALEVARQGVTANSLAIGLMLSGPFGDRETRQVDPGGQGREA